MYGLGCGHRLLAHLHAISVGQAHHAFCGFGSFKKVRRLTTDSGFMAI